MSPALWEYLSDTVGDKTQDKGAHYSSTFEWLDALKSPYRNMMGILWSVFFRQPAYYTQGLVTKKAQTNQK